MTTLSCPICRMAYPHHKMDCQNASYVAGIEAESNKWLRVAQDLEKENEALVEGIKRIIEDGYPPTPKAEQCSHGQYGYQDCIGCVDDALAALLPKEKE